MLHVKVGDVFKIKEGDEAIIRNIERHVLGVIFIYTHWQQRYDYKVFADSLWIRDSHTT